VESNRKRIGSPQDDELDSAALANGVKGGTSMSAAITLAGRAAVRGELTGESTREQKGAGLDQCSAEEFERKGPVYRPDFPVTGMPIPTRRLNS
jgi:hypothetical protein